MTISSWNDDPDNSLNAVADWPLDSDPSLPNLWVLSLDPVGPTGPYDPSANPPQTPLAWIFRSGLGHGFLGHALLGHSNSDDGNVGTLI